jgi:hypothetical protein
MLPLKPFNGELFSVTCELDPAVRVSVSGDAVKVKSGLLAPVPAVTLRARVAVCFSEPDVPAKLTVAGEDVIAAVVEAVNVTACDVPGCSDRVAGLAVTPAGSPLIATPIVPLKPFNAELLTVTCVLPPAANVALVGDTAKVKSGTIGVVAVTVTETVAFALRSPEVPTTTTWVVPTAAEEAAAKVNVDDVPVVTVMLPGVTVTPVGRPRGEINTEPLKLSELVAITVKLRLSPCAKVTEESAVMVKVPALVAPHPLRNERRGRHSQNISNLTERIRLQFGHAPNERPPVDGSS